MPGVRSRAAKAKAAQETQARYDAAGQGRRIRSWNPPSGVGPNRATLGLQKIRDRSRDAKRNDWGGASSVQKWTTTLIGTGITPRWKLTKFNELWTKHAKRCDADGVLNFDGLLALATRTWMASGEVFCRRRPRDLSLVLAGKLAAPVQYQLLAAEFVPIFDAEHGGWKDLPAGNRISQGIEFNKYGRRVAYWMYREHPGDQPSGVPSFESLIRVPADDVFHLYELEEPGQIRGVSHMAPVLTRLRASGDFEDAVLDRQKLANLFVAFLRREMPDKWDEIERDPLTGLPKWYDDRGNPLAGLEPGMFQELMAGESVEFANPPEAGTTFSEYMRTTHLGTAAGGGMPYELFSGDILNVSDRTLRVIINEFRRLAEQRQWHNIIPMACEPMVRWWAEALTLTGDISVAEVEEAASPEWHPHGWADIHPVQDVEGKLKAIEGGLISRSAVISKRGDDPAQVDQQRADDQQREKDLKIAPPPAPAGPGAPAAEPKEPPPPAKALGVTEIVALITAAQPPAPVARQDDPVVLATLSALQAMTAQMASMMTAHAEQQARNAEANVAMLEALRAIAERPATPVNVQNTIEPTPVTVTAPNVTVQAPNVAITNEAPVLEVTANVNLPDREITTESVEHDENGRIIAVRQVEKTIQ